MKARLVLEQFINPENAPEYLQAEIKTRFGKNPMGKVVPIFFITEGTIIEGEQSVMMCRTGQCTPADDECAKAVGLNAAQISALQVDYKMNTLGINSKEDRELYRAGVITGYDANLKPIPGPNWEAYQQAKAELEKADDIE